MLAKVSRPAAVSAAETEGIWRQRGERHHFGRAAAKAEARHDETAEARALPFAAHAVEREQQRAQQDVRHTERVELQMPRLDDQHDADHVERKTQNLILEIFSRSSKNANSVTNTGLLENSTPTTDACTRVTAS